MNPILAHLSPRDIQNLRLTARCFRSDAAVLESCVYVQHPRAASMKRFQAGLSFLQQLPKLTRLSLAKPWTLTGVEQLSRLTMVQIVGCEKVLDLYPVSVLQRVQELIIEGCKAKQLADISELSNLVAVCMYDAGELETRSGLTGLESLHIWGPEDVKLSKMHAFSSLTGLTSLQDNDLSSSVWHTLSRVELLDINTCPASLQGMLFPARLRALAIDTGDAEHGQVLDSLAPLSSLTRLEYLDLTGCSLPVPPLQALTRLTLEFRPHEGDVPDLGGAPQLQVLELWVKSQVCLPDLSRLAHLATIMCNDDYGSLIQNVCCVGRHKFVYIQLRHCLETADQYEM